MSNRGGFVAVGPGEGTTVQNPLGEATTFKVRGEESGGALMVFENVVAPKAGPPLHTHANEDEGIYVLEGEFRFKLGERFEPAPAGSFVFIPRGAPHTWQNIGETPGRIMVTFTPSGMERFFERFGSLSDPDPRSAFQTLGKEVGMDVVGPPLAQSDPL